MPLPLTVRVGFKARLEARNVIQIPCVIRWQYKMEPGQVLKVWVKLAEAIGGGEGFHGRMRARFFEQSHQSNLRLQIAVNPSVIKSGDVGESIVRHVLK